MKFLQYLIKESKNELTPSEFLTEEEKRVKPDHVYGKIGEFTLLVKWLEIDNYEDIKRDYDDETAYVTYSGTINCIAVIVRRGNEEYLVEVYPADPIDSSNTDPSWVENAEVSIISNGTTEQDSELEAFIDKLTRGFLANNWGKLLDDVFTKEETIGRKRGYPVNNDELVDY